MTEPGLDARPQVPATTHPLACLLGQVSFLQSGHQGILISRSRADQMRYLGIYLGMEPLCQMATCTFVFGEMPKLFSTAAKPVYIPTGHSLVYTFEMVLLCSKHQVYIHYYSYF